MRIRAQPDVDLDRIEAAVDEEVARLAATPPSQEELDRVINGLVTGFVGALETVEGKADRLNDYLYYAGNPGLRGAGPGPLPRADPGRRPAGGAAVPGRPEPRDHQHRAAGQDGARRPGEPVMKRTLLSLAAGAALLAAPRRRSRSRLSHHAAASARARRGWTCRSPLRMRLPNGLTVMYVRQAELPVVSAVLVTRGAGSADEPAEAPGLASFTANMLDEGAGGRDALAAGRRAGPAGRVALHGLRDGRGADQPVRAAAELSRRAAHHGRRGDAPRLS